MAKTKRAKSKKKVARRPLKKARRPGKKKTTKKAQKPPSSAPAAPPPAATDGAATQTFWNGLLVGRKRCHQLEIRFANCSITQVEARAYALGLYCEVAPSGPASYIDEALDGAVGEFMGRRMFSGRVGEVFVMPANRRQLPVDAVLFIGLGFFDQFKQNAENVLEIAGENTLRTFAQTRIEDYATVLMGVTSGRPIETLVKHLITGLVRGKRDADRDHHFRRVTICELDKGRYEEIRQAVYRLAGTPLFDEVELNISDLRPQDLRQTVLRPRAEAGPARPLDPAYLIVRQDGRGKAFTLNASLLTAGGKAAIHSDSRPISASELNAFYKKVDKIKPMHGAAATLAQLQSLGAELRSLFLGDDTAKLLAAHRDHQLVVVHDAETSRLPWELLNVDKWVPAVGKGLSRRYMADNLSIVKYLEQRIEQPRIRMLLVVNPTQDLPGAEKEGNRVKKLLADQASFQLDVLHGPEATHAALKGAFESGVYDVVHYAGHAFFDPQTRSQSGLICADEEVLSGADLANLPNLPALVVFNACESGRVRHYFSRKKKKAAPEDMVSVAQMNIGLAEAFLRGGVANYVGTYWPVDDTPAVTFAATFYDLLLKGTQLGEALVATRKKLLEDLQEIDWADYIFYGDQNFVLRRGPSTNGNP